jgi:hypothetical protein
VYWSLQEFCLEQNVMTTIDFMSTVMTRELAVVCHGFGMPFLGHDHV